jgi:anti-sigma-K factor RskA
VDIKEYISSGIIESYVLGLASWEEVEEFEKMCAAHSEVRNARELFEQQLEENTIALGVLPPRKLKSLVLSEIEIDAQKFGTPSMIASPKQLERPKHIEISPSIWKYAAAASIILLLGSGILNFYFLSQYKKYSTQYSQLLDSQAVVAANANQVRMNAENYAAAIKMMHDTNMATVKMVGVQRHRDNSATVFWDKKTKDVYFMADNLPKPPAGMQYQLWAIVDGKPIAAGLLNWESPSVGTPVTNIQSAQAFAITLEKAGGSESPTEDAMIVMGNT